MPIHFIDNYAKQNLETTIINQDGNTLFGELWLYEQFLSFNNNQFVEDEIWYFKHNYNLSTHPSSKRKVEGQVDFLLLSKQGLLIIEVKGGGLRVDENDCYFSSGGGKEYETQNPFTQAKEYVHTFKKLIDSSVFVYRAVVLPHEAGFILKSPQLVGYRDIFFSKADITGLNERAIQTIFFKFINELGRKARIRMIKELFPNLSTEVISKKAYEQYPELSSKELKRLKSELFPTQSTYGYNPDRINAELILKENYEVLKGLSRNKNVIIQGAPGTGKTALAIKFLAENLLKQQKGIVFCANKLIRSKLEHIILNDYQLDPNNIDFRIFSDVVTQDSVTADVDFLIFDEAQEYFDKGLYDFIEKIISKLDKPKILVLYDPDQAIASNLKELAWYTDFFIEIGYTHYHFNENYRCAQNIEIGEISNCLLYNEYGKIKNKYKSNLMCVDDLKQKLELFSFILNDVNFTSSEKIILIHSNLIEDFIKIVSDYFYRDIEELTEANINISSNKVRYSSPIKYRGLENESVYLITKELNDNTKVQNYIGATRAMNSLKIILWK
ncbi:NERD domain-containing protein [Flavobacterium frigidarium]|uniref:NERD domain-containing protein n=1 Tax=Flavobacterium frigidarium TaxID=99286 RepID=UPI00042A9171|nr:NERD domain-containing protein [Flavobacterium frigidarium]